MMQKIKLIGLALLAVMILIVVLQNRQAVETHVLFTTITMSQAVSLFVALAIGFAFKDYVSSLLAGIVVLYERPYRPGDWVEIDEIYGEVQSLGLRTVVVLTPDDTLVHIPHGKIWNSAVQNANSGKLHLMCVADFYVLPDHDGLRVRDALYDVAFTSAYVQLDRPIIVVAAEQPWGTHYRAKAYPLDARDQFQFITDLTLRGKRSLCELGVQPALASPLAQTEGA